MYTLFTVLSPFALVQSATYLCTCAANPVKVVGEWDVLDDILPATTEGEAFKLSFGGKSMLIKAFVVPARPLFVPSFLRSALVLSTLRTLSRTSTTL